MSARRRLHQVRELELLQRVDRDLAGSAVADAQAREAEAREAADRYGVVARALADQWYACLSAANFQPEQHRAIGGALIGAVEVAEESERKLEDAAQLREQRIDHWRLADARLRATGRIAGDLARRQERRDEEAGLRDVAARVALKWSCK